MGFFAILLTPGARVQESVLGAVLSSQVCGFKLLLGQCPTSEAVAVVHSFLKLLSEIFQTETRRSFPQEKILRLNTPEALVGRSSVSLKALEL